MPDQRFDVFRNMQIYMAKLVDHVRKNVRPNGRPRLCWYAEQHPLADGERHYADLLPDPHAVSSLQFLLARAPSPAIIVANWMQAGTEFGFWRRFKFHCVQDSGNSNNCQNYSLSRLCFLHKVCESVPEGLEGNRYELLSILSWAEQFWANSDDGFGIDPDDDSIVFHLSHPLIMAVAVALRHLLVSFDNFVKSHRRAHSLTGTNVAQDTYAQWVSNRVPLLARPVSVPVTAPEWEKLAGEVPSTQHLRVMEESARSWYTGVMAFQQDVEGFVTERPTGIFPPPMPLPFLTTWANSLCPRGYRGLRSVLVPARIEGYYHELLALIA
ncbi:hypothetical protein PENPOL_c007G06025 [Penicillium polonicum]|uniref:Uncharacterized protein n=1 Tax=Penicillium polonicum TaxID=60169 RepID=A0A1V6NJD8_PENPO|nr:hypothetical protein PENPOL_c007G06025 [Penicillium polonicum]